MASLQVDIRQFFSQSVLRRFDRLDEAGVDYTFDPADIYLSVFADAIGHLDAAEHLEYDHTLASYARVFERFVLSPSAVVSVSTSGLVASALFWLSGYTANSFLMAKAILARQEPMDLSTRSLLFVLARQIGTEAIPGELGLVASVRTYLLEGDPQRLDETLEGAKEVVRGALVRGNSDQYLASTLLIRVLRRLRKISFWSSIEGRATAPIEQWRRYVQLQAASGIAMFDLWPSQREAIAKGLLDGQSSLTLRMPTSAGKTKMTELTFANDLFSDGHRRCLYLAPFRALVSEVEGQIGETLAQLGFSVASLYGGSDASGLEVRLAERARVVIATPEKIEAVLKQSGQTLNDFGTIVLDEGHLIDSLSRGAAYELQLARLKVGLGGQGRTIFLSAVLPNAIEVAAWLGGSVEALAEDLWQPTTLRVGIVAWPKDGRSRLSYLSSTGQELVDRFFVPRIVEEDEWKELNPDTGRLNIHRFPSRGDGGSIAAALAFGYAKDGPVVIYTSRPDWAEGIAKRIVDRVALQRPIVTNLVDDSNRDELAAIADYLDEVLGEHSILPKAVRLGVAFHHGRLPQSVRLVIEEEYRKQTLRLLIATNTLAQGVNLPIRFVVVHSLPQSDRPIRDFWNLAGRAGRALRESEGEVLILGTGSISQRTLRKFLDRNQVEAAESMILALARTLMEQFGGATRDSIAALLNSPAHKIAFEASIESLDRHILELIVEDLPLEVEQARVDDLVQNLFAYYQAEKEDLVAGSDLRATIVQLAHARLNLIRERIPEPERRAKYASAGLSIDSCVAIDDSIEALIQIVQGEPELTEEVFIAITAVAAQCGELDADSLLHVQALGLRWRNLATYGELFQAGGAAFADYGEMIRFVEDVLCYRLPWVLNGLKHLLTAHIENLEEDIAIPDWFEDLPQQMRYGVPSKELVWIMAMGVPEKRVAQWINDKFAVSRNRAPTSMRDLVDWALESRLDVEREMSERWPKYFAKVYGKSLDRFVELRELLVA